MGSQSLRHDWETNTFTLSYICVCVCVFFFILFPIIVYPWMPLPLALTPSPLSFVKSRVLLFSSPSSHPEKLWLSLHRLSCTQKSPQPLSVLWAYKSVETKSQVRGSVSWRPGPLRKAYPGSLGSGVEVEVEGILPTRSTGEKYYRTDIVKRGHPEAVSKGRFLVNKRYWNNC